MGSGKARELFGGKRLANLGAGSQPKPHSKHQEDCSISGASLVLMVLPLSLRRISNVPKVGAVQAPRGEEAFWLSAKGAVALGSSMAEPHESRNDNFTCFDVRFG